MVENKGAELLRLWAAYEDFRYDVGYSKAHLDQVSDAYFKIRNTIRFLLGNLYDYDPASGFGTRIDGGFKVVGANLNAVMGITRPGDWGVDVLQFTGVASYKSKLEAYQKSTGLKDAVICATGRIGGVETVLLEIKYDFFTGGFLAVNVLHGVRQILAFFASASFSKPKIAE